MDDNNNVPEVPAASRIERLEFSLELANEMLVERRKAMARRDATIANLQSASNEQQRTIAEQRRTIAERDHTIAEQRGTIAELERANVEKQHTIDDQRRVFIELSCKLNDETCSLATHAQLAAAMGAPVARPPVGVPPGDDVAQGNGTVQGDGATDDAASGDGDDDLNNTASGADDALTNAASGADDDDLVDAASGTDDTTADDDTGAATTDDAASGADDDAPADEIAVSLHVAKRRRLSQRGLEYMHPFVLIGHDVLAAISKHAIRRPLIPAGVDPQEFRPSLAGLEPFTFSMPQRMRAGLSGLAGLHLLRRSDVDLATLRTNGLQQLGVAERPGAVVLGPRLCYVLVTLCGIPLAKMSGLVLNKVFETITAKSLGELMVATRHGVGRMTEADICNLVRDWVQNLCTYITRDGGVESSLEAATLCNDYYTAECNKSR
ncbi:hypothetical protein GGI19_006607, partial [Coemansia pectinata]